MKIFCVGRNYSEHAKELGNEVPESPVIFCKPDTALLKNNKAFYYPAFSNDIHYEVELVIRINKAGKNIAEKFASNYYSEYGIGIDFTARDVQQKQKSKGLPWEIAKAFDSSAPISEFLEIGTNNISNIDFSLKKNGAIVQEGCTKDMLFSVDKIVSYISTFFTLKIGDLIYTGTPPGVGPVKIGDKLEASIAGNKMLECIIK